MITKYNVVMDMKDGLFLVFKGEYDDPANWEYAGSFGSNWDAVSWIKQKETEAEREQFERTIGDHVEHVFNILMKKHGL